MKKRPAEAADPLDEMRPYLVHSDKEKDWLERRNRALANLDMQWAREQSPRVASDEVVLIGLHKARYECRVIAAELRHESGAWLRERNYNRSHGPLLPEGELP